MQSGSKMFTVDQFLGINEAADSLTELAMGEASRMENFFVTDGYNLTLRPAVVRPKGYERENYTIAACWAGNINDGQHMVIVNSNGTIRIFRETEDGIDEVLRNEDNILGINPGEVPFVKIFPFDGKIFIMSQVDTASYVAEGLQLESPYIPLVIAGAAPSGGGTAIENANLLSAYRRIDYSADGTSTEYVLPDEAENVTKVTVDGHPAVSPSVLGTFDATTHIFTFKGAPIKGVGNVEIEYSINKYTADNNRRAIARSTLAENYNGSTDTRVFVANGNTLYYSGVTQSGEATPMYFPAMNEIAVDMDASFITGMVRHYSNLLVFTGAGAYTVVYEPTTLDDGRTIAGFSIRNVNREIGHESSAAIQIVNNFPRTITQGGIYSWNVTSGYYRDERNAKKISDRVKKSFAVLTERQVSQIRTADDNHSQTYYVFLNDGAGTVLVNRYGLGKGDIWCVYRGTIFRDVRHAMTLGGKVYFTNENDLFCFDPAENYDIPNGAGYDPVPITALWESGYMSFGADFLRKYSSQIYVSMLPQTHSGMTVTASTDRREEYMEKNVGCNIFSWEDADFRWWSFITNMTPRISRIRLKIKKFVYYKLIFRVEEPGARATVLGYDQVIRYGSMAK